LAWLAVGLLAYLTLPLRALSQPPVNWGNPVTLNNFGWLVSGKLYQDQLFALPPSSVWERVQASASLLLEQFGFIGLVIGLVGLVVFYKPSRLYRHTIWTVVSFSAFAVKYAADDSFLHLIPAFLCFAIWIGIGISGLMNAVSQRFPKIGFAVGLLFSLSIFIQAGNHWTQADASRDLRAERFGKEVFAQAPARALVFTKGDQATFALWYFHYALRQRPDLVVIAPDLLTHPWYQDALRKNYPDLILPDFFPFPAAVIASNPDRGVCYVQYNQSAQIKCQK
jgi:hypothetical protein